MPDICDLILDDHEVFRRRFAEMDTNRTAEPSVIGKLWDALAEHLERHADAEEKIFYPSLLEEGDDNPVHDTKHAIRDHNKIRDAVRGVAAASVGTEEWWSEVDRARAENGEHMAEEEDGPLADFRQNAKDTVRAELGSDFVAFNSEHAGGRNVDSSDTDPEAFVEAHTD